jgi:hypothetical protein
VYFKQFTATSVLYGHGQYCRYSGIGVARRRHYRGGGFLSSTQGLLAGRGKGQLGFQGFVLCLQEVHLGLEVASVALPLELLGLSL